LGLLSTIYTRACRCVRASIPALFLAVTAAGGLGLTLACTGGGGDNNGGGGTTVTAPAITTQPVSQTVNEGASVSFTVVASGTTPLHYQWKKGATNVGTNSATFTIASVQLSDAGSYTVTVSNAAATTATSTAAVLTVNAAVVAPAITTHPVSQTVTAGDAASFTVVATGTAPLHYQWKKGATNVGTDSATLNIPSAQESDEGSYTVVVSNAAATTATSNAATLTVNPAGPVAPSITTHPVSQTTTVGGSVTFTVVATGTAPLHYQWKKGATNVGTDSASFTINSVVEGDAGSYTVTVTNSVSNVTSNAATLTVNAASLNLALNKTATASSTENAGTAASAAVDGNAGTRWSSAFSDPQWIMVDLGSVLSFNNVVLNWEAACATAYQIQTSDNGTDWATIHTETAGVAGVKSILFGSVNARYVRVYGTARATVYGYSLFEFEVYSLTQYLITTSAGTHGSISPSGDVAVVSGQNQSFTITPDSGYLVSDVQVDGTSVGAVTTYTFSNVTAAHTISATFAAIPTYLLTATAGPNGGISPVGDVSVLQGANQTFTFTPADGYTVATVMVDGVDQGPRSSYTFSNVAASHTIHVTFAVPAQFTITASAGANGSISPTGAVSVTQGTNQTFTITADNTFAVTDVLVDGVSVGSRTSYTFTNVQGNHTIAASFGATGGLAWSDEFDGPSIDSSKWAFDIGNGNSGWGNGEWEYYTSSPDNVSIVDGKLVISEMPDTFGGKSFTSSRLITRGRYSFNRGRFVARIKFPGGNMIWPCFWLLGDRTETWPKCGEIDIAEMFCGATGTGDNTITAAAHWFQDSTNGGGDYGLTKTHTAALSADYHDYELEWTDTTLTAKFDGVEFWSLGISDSNLSELKDFPYNIILNMAVGKPGFGMTAANQATQVPQKMYVDYVRVYSNTTSTVIDKVAEQRSGNLDILADGTTCSSAMVLGTDQNLFLWNNLVDATGTPAAGTASLAYATSGTQWFGLGLNATNRHNLLNYAGGYLNFSMKTTSLDPIKIGVAGGDNSNAWVNFTNGSDPYGFARDGAWHQISIPMTKFAGADFSDISQYFMFVSNLPEGGLATVGQKWEFDEIYWSENAPENIVKPVGTKFGLFTDAACDAGSFTAGGVDGDIFVWNSANNTILTGTPFEGANSYAFSAPNAAWYGMGFTPTKLYDLSAFAAGHLHLRLKVPASSTSSFKIGLKSPGGQTVRESWINFKNGSDPYGFVRDGAYHEVVIPAGDFCNSDLGAIAQLLMIAGDGPATIEFDDVYWSSN